MDTFIGIVAGGRYPHERLPVGLRDTLEQEILKHMEAYGLRKVAVITEEDDRKRAYAKELYGALNAMTEWAGGIDAPKLPAPWPEMVAVARALLSEARGEDPRI